MNIETIILDGIKNEKTYDEINKELEGAGSPVRLNTNKKGNALLDTGTGSLDPVTVENGKLTNGNGGIPQQDEVFYNGKVWWLDDDRVKFVVQQYVRTGKDEYALADLYLPQLNIFIEVNEPFHENNVERDNLRNEKIMDITHSELHTIVCGTGDKNDKDKIHWKPLDEIHRSSNNAFRNSAKTSNLGTM